MIPKFDGRWTHLLDVLAQLGEYFHPRQNMLHDSWQVVMEIAVNHWRLKVTLASPRYFSNGSLGHCWVMTSSFAVEYFGALLQASQLAWAINLEPSLRPLAGWTSLLRSGTKNVHSYLEINFSHTLLLKAGTDSNSWLQFPLELRFLLPFPRLFITQPDWIIKSGCFYYTLKEESLVLG